MPIPEFLNALDIMRKVHETKNADYADSNNAFSNFDVSEYGLKLFPSPRHGSFAWPIFTKLARLSVLLGKKEKPNHESIEDTFIDIANYILLWRADYLNGHKPRVNPDIFNYVQCSKCGKVATHNTNYDLVYHNLNPLAYQEFTAFFCSITCQLNWYNQNIDRIKIISLP